MFAWKLPAGAGTAEHRMILLHKICRCDIVCLSAPAALPHIKGIILGTVPFHKTALLANFPAIIDGVGIWRKHCNILF